MLHAAELALDPDLKEVHVMLVDETGRTKRLKVSSKALSSLVLPLGLSSKTAPFLAVCLSLFVKLPALSIAVVAEEAMYAPLPDGWQKAQDAEGRLYYYNRWLAGRAPTYDHPLDDSYHKLCIKLQQIAVGVVEGKKHYQQQYDDLEEYPAVSVSTGGPNQVRCKALSSLVLSLELYYLRQCLSSPAVFLSARPCRWRR
eukprot:SAG22_NODE_434_length_10555_cov_3.917559_7_plen_199_part_00